ncbi:MAG: FtsW/RodA/SpoVE family cell cycle protein [Sphaerochaetaceae bacterium]
MKKESLAFMMVSLTLISLGLLCMYSASYPQAHEFNHSGSYFLIRQAVFAIAAIASCVAIFLIPMKVFKVFLPLLLVLCLVLMLLTIFTRMGQTTLGARRWLTIGPLPSFQPSELVKFTSILFLASILSAGESKTLPMRQMIATAVCLMFGALILMQKDYSTTAVYIGVCICMLLLSGVSLPWVVLGFLFIGAGGTAVLLSEPYRVKRIAAFLFPELDPGGINYQVTIAKKAISSGGIFGKGFGLGYYKHGILPEVQNDFILASMAEELGFAGILAVFALLMTFSVIGYRSARRMMEKDAFSAYMAFGFTTMILWQALVNAAVVSGLFPPTGIPMPFFSQGGTNLFVVICEAGFLLRITNDSLKDPDPAKEHAGFQKTSDDYVFPTG